MATGDGNRCERLLVFCFDDQHSALRLEAVNRFILIATSQRAFALVAGAIHGVVECAATEIFPHLEPVEGGMLLADGIVLISDVNTFSPVARRRSPMPGWGSSVVPLLPPSRHGRSAAMHRSLLPACDPPKNLVDGLIRQFSNFIATHLWLHFPRTKGPATSPSAREGQGCTFCFSLPKAVCD